MLIKIPHIAASIFLALNILDIKLTSIKVANKNPKKSKLN